jgi:hypothetical protein
VFNPKHELSFFLHSRKWLCGSESSSMNKQQVSIILPASEDKEFMSSRSRLHVPEAVRLVWRHKDTKTGRGTDKLSRILETPLLHKPLTP